MPEKPQVEAKREAAVQAMIAKGYTRERAERLLFDVVGKALFGPGGAFGSPEPSGFDLPGMWEDSDLIGGSTEPLSPPGPRVHNHQPYRPICNEREVDGQFRGACLNDDGSDR